MLYSYQFHQHTRAAPITTSTTTLARVQHQGDLAVSKSCWLRAGRDVEQTRQRDGALTGADLIRAKAQTPVVRFVVDLSRIGCIQQAVQQIHNKSKEWSLSLKFAVNMDSSRTDESTSDVTHQTRHRAAQSNTQHASCTHAQTSLPLPTTRRRPWAPFASH